MISVYLTLLLPLFFLSSDIVQVSARAQGFVSHEEERKIDFFPSSTGPPHIAFFTFSLFSC